MSYKILVTGGAGYIGSHTILKLISSDFRDIVVIDNLSTGNEKAVLPPTTLIKSDLYFKKVLDKIFRENKFEAVIHFAASKDAAESVENPKKYYQNNIVNGLNLLNAMVSAGVKKIIFSSSAAVYGDAQKIPIDESAPTEPINPYGWSKLMFEKILVDYEKAYGLQYVSLRYFNAGGADIGGKLGIDFQNGKDLVSVLMQVALGRKK